MGQDSATGMRRCGARALIPAAALCLLPLAATAQMQGRTALQACLAAGALSDGPAACFAQVDAACSPGGQGGARYDLCMFHANEAMDAALVTQIDAVGARLQAEIGGMVQIVDLPGELDAWRTAREARCRRDGMVRFGFAGGLTRSQEQCRLRASLIRWHELEEAGADDWPSWP